MKKLGSKLLHHGSSGHKEDKSSLSRENTQDSHNSGVSSPGAASPRRSEDTRRSGHNTPTSDAHGAAPHHKNLVDRIRTMPLRPSNSRRSSSSSDDSGHAHAEAQEKKKARRREKDEKRRKAREAAAEIDRQHREAYDKVCVILCIVPSL